ncbi:MAG TPA: PD-(D/E)XK nuclease family protein [Anaerolineae bacterium]|nr:PD-(D/E)XK nuclease family protein [Anaerolineae bacterium]
MPLPPDFTFSQNNLQDFLDCERRFELRYLLKQDWPAVESNPYLAHEQRIELGKQFHQLIHQHQSGIDAVDLEKHIQNPDLLHWWKNYLAYLPEDIPEKQYAEIILAIPFCEYRMIAKYDLLAIEEDQRAIILDWKTTSLSRRPNGRYLHHRIQTKVYPFIFSKAGSILNNGNAWAPYQISMVYWFPNFPHQPENISYSEAQLSKDQDFLTGLIGKIVSRDAGAFQLTRNQQFCKYCVYRSLCERGIKAGNLDDQEEFDSATNSFDLDQIEEIAF